MGRPPSLPQPPSPSRGSPSLTLPPLTLQEAEGVEQPLGKYLAPSLPLSPPPSLHLAHPLGPLTFEKAEGVE